LTNELPLARSHISKTDLEKIQMQGIEPDSKSFLYGEFRMPGVLTNDLVNNKEVINNSESTSISMGHVKRVKKD
jgi:hypothetical protein